MSASLPVTAQDAQPEPWRRLDRSTVLVGALVGIGTAVLGGAIAGYWVGRSLGIGVALAWVLPAAVVLVLAVTGVEELRWRRERYRVGAERVELRSGILFRKQRGLGRERVRTVDLTANPLLRLFGLVTVRIGTGEQTSAGQSSLQLSPVRRAEGDRLRRVLLDRHAGSHGAAASPQPGMLATLDLAWARYAPASVVTPVLGGAAVGAVLQGSEWFGLQQTVIDSTIEVLSPIGLIWGIAVLAAVTVFLGAIGSLGLWVEMWWNHRLEREPGGTVRVRRGLLTTRSISLEERRIRGVDLVEPLGVRLLGAARVDAVVTGLAERTSQDKSDRNTLLPAAPKARADAVAAEVLREPEAPTLAVRLRAHPPAARARRLRWAATAVLVPAAVLGLLGLLLTPVLTVLGAVVVVLGMPAALLLARDAYRALGHGLTGEYLVTRSGTVRRSTVALHRDGIIGWTATQSVFQRRAGLITLWVTTAAGAGAYVIRDVGTADGLTFAETAIPLLIEQFLED